MECKKGDESSHKMPKYSLALLQVRGKNKMDSLSNLCLISHLHD